MKIIQILSHSPSWITKNIEEDIYDGWHIRTAKAIQQITDEFTIECWLPEKTFHRVFTEVRNGIIYKIFPSTGLTYGREISLPMIDEIKKYTLNPLILHIHGLHNYLTYLLSHTFNRFPIIVQHHGDCPPVNLIEHRKLLIPFIPILSLEQLAMNYALKSVDHFFVLTQRERDALAKTVDSKRISIQNMGIDFKKFTAKDKIESRKILKLPLEPDCKILLYVGKFRKNKGCDKVIEVFKELKKKYRVLLLLVGGREDDPLYPDGQNSGAIIYNRQPQEKMPFFYSAADVTLLPSTPAWNDWGGIGICLIESLACGTPVVAGTLRHFPGEIAKVGFVTTKTEEVIKRVETIFENPQKFPKCRAEARKYFDWQIIGENTVRIYHQLATKYYGWRI